MIERIGEGIQASPYQVVWTRYGTHLALMVLVLGTRRRGALVRTSRPALQITASLLMLGMPVCFIAALQRMDVTEVMSVFWISSVIIAPAAVLLLGEDPNPLHLAGVLGAAAGAVLVTGPHGGLFRLAAVFPLAMACCFAAYLLTIRALRREPVSSKLFHTAFWVFLALSLALPSFWRRPSAGDLLAMTAIGALGCLALLALDRALELAPALIVAAATCTQPVWVELINHGRLNRTATIGAAIVAAGTALCAIAGRVAFIRHRHAPSSHGAAA